MKKPGIPSLRVSGLIFAGIVFLLLIACPAMKQSAVHPPATIPGAEYVGMESCAGCHEKTVKDFKYARHAKLSVTLPDGKEIVGCESCHGAGSLHMAAGGGKGVAIINPGENPSTCFQCHSEIQGFFNLQYHHPMGEQGVSCNDCHSPHGEDIMVPAGVQIGQHNAPCAECHRDQSRPFVFEHEALREGCTICHSPHGSFNDKLLVAGDANLCLRCHAQILDDEIFVGTVDHTRLERGTCWAAGCHRDVHGSNTHSSMRH